MTPRQRFPPVFATNRPSSGETVADAINTMFAGVREKHREPPEIDLATAYLNPAGFDLIADEVERAPAVRILLGAEPQVTHQRQKVDPSASLSEGLARERDLVGFTLDADRQARRLVAWLEQAAATGTPIVAVRRFTKGFLHGKAFIANDDTMPYVLAGSSNLTYAGLMTNLELNLGYPTHEHAHLVIEWFDELWAESEPYDLAGFYGAATRPVHRVPANALRTVWLRAGRCRSSS